MYLDVVSKTTETPLNGNQSYQKKKIFDKWKNWPPSVISHHGTKCCEIAREWIAATDYSELVGQSPTTGPRWLRQKFKWGCSTFPIYWCQAVRKNTLDCGALAALTNEIFTVRGVKNYRVQMVQKFSPEATRQWIANWTEKDSQTLWIEKDLIYHEGCAIELADKQIKIWDSSAGWWVDANSGQGYGALLAIRLSHPNSNLKEKFVWGKYVLQKNCWQTIT